MYACENFAEWPDGHFRAMTLQEHYLHKCLDIFIKEKELYLENYLHISYFKVIFFKANTYAILHVLPEKLIS